MTENGEEKLIAVARHIAKTLGHSDTMTCDILKIFSNFDGRLRDKLSKDTAEQTVNSLGRKLSRQLSSDAPIWSNSADSSAFLASVDRLIAVVSEWTPLADDDSGIAACVERADGLLHQSMSRLRDEFRILLQRSDSSDGDDDFSDDACIPAVEITTSYDTVVEPLPAGTVVDLREIAKRMAAAGCVEECFHVYVTCRREFLEDAFLRKRLQKMSSYEVQRMDWAQLEDEIDKWIKAFNAALRVLFPSERRLCDGVFSGLSSTADLAFEEACSSVAIKLLNFADEVATGSRSPERLFKVLDVYETIRDLMPEFELLFSDHSLRDEAVAIWQRLAGFIKGVFVELENLINRDPAKAVVPGGGLHPINRYVMNYLCAACRSYQTMEQVFEKSIVGDGIDYENGDDDSALVSSSSCTSLVGRVAWLMELLESNLEVKSKAYRDPALCSVFMMNNMRYIVQKVKGSEMGLLLGDDWIRKHMAKIRQYHVSYQRSSWAKVLGVLKVDNNSLSPNGSSKSLREKLKLFNSYFDEMCKIQSSWVIFDDQLREELRISVSGTVSPAYRSFLGRLQASPDVRKHGDHRYIRHSVEDVEARISALFQGSSGRR